MNIVHCPDTDACARAASAADELPKRRVPHWKRWGGVPWLAGGVFAAVVGLALLAMSQLGPFAEFEGSLATGGLFLLFGSVPLLRLGAYVSDASTRVSARGRHGLRRWRLR